MAIKKLTILIAADGHGSKIYDEALAQGFRNLGHNVTRFTWLDYFKRAPYANAYNITLPLWKSIYYRIQNKFTIGPAMFALNRALKKEVNATSPDLLFIYRGTHIWPSTLKYIRTHHPKTLIMGYNNDDPFAPQYPPYFWRHFKRGLPFYHHLFAYRPKNLSDYAQATTTPATLLPPYYLPKDNAHIPAAKQHNHIIFIGHYEPDGRDDTLLYLIQNNIPLKLYGTDWDKSPHYPAFKTLMNGDITPLRGDAYNLALNQARGALVFLSHLNQDVYTRRCFEIPPTQTPMLLPETDALKTFFTPEKEALYYTNKNTLLTQCQRLIKDETLAQTIGQNAQKRLKKDGHTHTHRAQDILNMVPLK